MANNIGGISGYGNYGVGGYVPQRHNGEAKQEVNEQAQQPAAQETQVDPSKVMEFLDKYNYFAPAETQSAVKVGEVDAATQDRIAGYMEQFEFIYGLVQEEFGEEMAPVVMDLVMDKLMGMV